MRLASKPWLLFGFIAAASIAVVFAIDSYRHRFVRSNADLVALVSRDHMTLFFANVQLLREAGLLHFLVGPKTATAQEYEQFVQETHFDYTRDIDAIAGAADNSQTFVVVRGRFDWDRLNQYALSHGGISKAGVLTVSTSRRDRWASFVAIQSDVVGLVVSSDSLAAKALVPHGARHITPAIPQDPVWVKVSQAVLKNPADIPLPLRIFAISMQPASAVLISLDGNRESTATPFGLQLRAECTTKVTAEIICSQLQIQTKMLRLELAHEHADPSPADLTGLLAAGTFEVTGKQVIGKWPVHKELIESLSR